MSVVDCRVSIAYAGSGLGQQGRKCGWYGQLLTALLIVEDPTVLIRVMMDCKMNTRISKEGMFSVCRDLRNLKMQARGYSIRSVHLVGGRKYSDTVCRVCRLNSSLYFFDDAPRSYYSEVTKV